MAKEKTPFEIIKTGSADEKRFYLDKAMWSDLGFSEQRKVARKSDLVFWFGGKMRLFSRVKCASDEEAASVVERFKDGVLPQGEWMGWQERGLCLEGMGVRVTDAKAKILYDCTLDHAEIAAGASIGGIEIVCDGMLFPRKCIRKKEAQVVVEGMDEETTQSYTMHVNGPLKLSAMKIHYKVYVDERGDWHAIMTDFSYDCGQGDSEFHQWQRSHPCRYYIQRSGRSSGSGSGNDGAELEVRVAIIDNSSVILRAWRGAEAFPIGVIWENVELYPEQHSIISDAAYAWSGSDGYEDYEDWNDDWEISLGVYGVPKMIRFLDEMKSLNRFVYDYRSEDDLSHETEIRKMMVCEGLESEILADAGWNPADGEDAAICIMANHCSTSLEAARIAEAYGVWNIPRDEK